MDPHGDVLLREVSHAFASLCKLLDISPPQEHARQTAVVRQERARQEELVRQLLLLEWRSRDVRNEFAEFYCVRLLLDHQSPLATYFIDLFSELDWMLWDLRGKSAIQTFHGCIWPAIQTCRLLYAAYRMLPRSRTLQGLDEQRSQLNGTGTDQFKREGIRHGRRFSWNELHCRIRKLGFVNLDRQGPSMVHLSAQLGQGAFAMVYRGDFKANDENGRTINIGDPVAVKMFSNSKSDSTEFGSRLWQSMEHMTQQYHEQSMTQHHEQGMDQFSWELGRLVSVRHPNIVTLRGYIGKRPQGESGLVMELMDESLHDYLEKVKRGGVPPLRQLEMLDLMLEIAKGMRFLHECNLVHRDLKPRNVLLRLCRDSEMQGCKFLEVKLADFGLTKLCDFAEDGSTMYTQTAFQGTSCYMAPELRVDAPSQESPDEIEKVDVFSYGTTCFNILMGNPDALAFSSRSVKVFYEAVKTGEWKQWVQGIDNHLQDIVKLIARCWESKPARRPTFAALCVLLQHSRLFLLSHSFVLDEILLQSGREIRSKLQFQSEIRQRVHMDFKLQYSHAYRSIITKCLRNGAVGGVKLISQCIHEFESSISAATHRNPSSLENEGLASDFTRLSTFMEAMKKILETSDFAQDVSILLEKGYFELMEHPKNFNVRELMDDLDPILVIKGLACCNVTMELMAGLDHILFIKCLSTMYEEGISRLLSTMYEEYGFDFKNDEAFCELTIDESLIPLLVTFWSISNMNPDSLTCDILVHILHLAGKI